MKLIENYSPSNSQFSFPLDFALTVKIVGNQLRPRQIFYLYERLGSLCDKLCFYYLDYNTNLRRRIK